MKQLTENQRLWLKQVLTSEIAFFEENEDETMKKEIENLAKKLKITLEVI